MRNGRLILKHGTEEFQDYLATAAEMLDAEEMHDASSLLRRAEFRVEETGYDNWDGGTTIWTIHIFVEPAEFSRLGTQREVLQEQIDTRLKPVLEQFTGDWYSVKIAPKVVSRPDWRLPGGGISRSTRQKILDGLMIEKVNWSGTLGDVDFLGRLYDLTALPSDDSRFPDAAGDIWQHRINNEDWDDDWVYSDKRFKLLDGSSDAFLQFLCQTVNPVVRPDRNEALKLVSHFNDQLRREDWLLVEEEKIAGRPKFVASRVNVTDRSVSRARTVADALDAGWMQKEIERLENAVERDPALAIGTAKELVETCCKSILNKRGVAITKSMSLPELTKLLAKELKLVPEGITDAAKGAKTIRLILRNLVAMTQYLAELRGLYGSGHGRDGKHRGLEPQHARLAVGAAVAFIDFVTATHNRRDESSNDEPKAGTDV